MKTQKFRDGILAGKSPFIDFMKVPCGTNSK